MPKLLLFLLVTDRFAGFQKERKSKLQRGGIIWVCLVEKQEGVHKDKSGTGRLFDCQRLFQEVERTVGPEFRRHCKGPWNQGCGLGGITSRKRGGLGSGRDTYNSWGNQCSSSSPLSSRLRGVHLQSLLHPCRLL